MRRERFVLYTCFFVSGAAALIYEVVWQRMLTLVFGVSTFSVAAVVSAFLAGLAVGSRLVGPLADRSRNPARLYALVELAIAVAGLASRYFVPPLMDAFRFLYEATDPGWLSSNLIRFALAFLAVGIPSLLIGATVPLMTRLLALRSGSVAVGFGRFYAVNTMGSVVGAALAGFVLIRFVGVHHALDVAVVGNLLAGSIAWVGLRRSAAPVAADESTEPVVSSAVHLGPAMRRFALLAAFLTGAVGLAYEVAWTRLLAVYTLNSVYVFTMIVTVYLTGLSLGAGIAARFLHGTRRPLNMLAAAQFVLGVLGPVALLCVPLAPRLGIIDPDRSAAMVFTLEYALAVAMAFVPTILIGMSFPLVVAVFGKDLSHSGRDVGRIYAWNAAGTILGAALTGLALVPFAGLRGTLLALAAVNVLIGGWAAAMEESPSRRWRMSTQLVAALFVFLVVLLPSNERFYQPAKDADESIVYYKEGPSATVHVAEYKSPEGSYRTLFVDSKSVAGTYDEIVTDQKMLAHLPLLLHPHPQRALTVGFGTGGTSFSMLQHRVKVDCVEIEPAVAGAYEQFRSENQGLVGPHHNRMDFRLILDDARSWLHVADTRYDVIVTDVTSIQYRGNGNLYTVEYFKLMRDRLRPGGLGCAWVPISGITPKELRILMRTFNRVYPHTSVWYMLNTPTDFVILVGSPGPLSIDLADIAERMAAPLVQCDLARIDLDNPYKLLACLLLAEDGVQAYAGEGPVHTDDRPILDYLVHAATRQNTMSANLSRLMEYRCDPGKYVVRWPAPCEGRDPQTIWQNWYAAAGHLLKGHALIYEKGPGRAEMARQEYEAAAELIPDDQGTKALVAGLRRARD